MYTDVTSGERFLQLQAVSVGSLEIQNQRNRDSEFDKLIDELLDDPTEQESMEIVECGGSHGKEVHLGQLQPLKELGEQDLQAILFQDIVDDGVNGTGMAPGAVSTAVVRVTDEPQILCQSSFPKPWEREQLLSPSLGDVSSTTESSPAQSEMVPSHEADLGETVDYIKAVLGRYEKIVQANGANGKIQVHQVVHLMLLATVHPDLAGKLNMDGTMTFCDANGKPGSKTCNHFRVQNTKAMGRIWQMIKGNRNDNFDTFARAMRVGRERNKAYFEYLESGKGSRKKVYRLGEKSIHEMKVMQNLLSKIC